MDFLVVMTFHGLFGFVVAVVILSTKYFVLLDDESKTGIEETQMLELTLQDCVILAFGVFVDAGSVFGQTVAF